jgi:hypothetical protein
MEATMRRLLGVLVMLSVVSFCVGTVSAADPMKDKEASPTLGERLTKDAIKGTLLKKSGEYYTIKDNDGMEHKVHVDKSTKLDTVAEGDKVKAYVTDKGHVTTLQRDK